MLSLKYLLRKKNQHPFTQKSLLNYFLNVFYTPKNKINYKKNNPPNEMITKNNLMPMHVCVCVVGFNLHEKNLILLPLSSQGVEPCWAVIRIMNRPWGYQGGSHDS